MTEIKTKIDISPKKGLRGAMGNVKDYLAKFSNLANFHAVHFHLSRLKTNSTTLKYLPQIKLDLSHLMSEIGAQLFPLPNDDMVFVVREISAINLERMIIRFKKTLDHDPRFKTNILAGDFYQLYDLQSESRLFTRDMDALVDILTAAEKNEDSDIHVDAAQGEPVIIEGIDVKTLNVIQTVLRQADASSFLRRQAICWIDGDKQPKPMFYQYYLSVQTMQEVLKITDAITGNIWLFKQLTTVLDRQMLGLLEEVLSKLGKGGNLHFNLNLRTFVTDNFREFVHQMSGKREITLEIDVLDIIAHSDVYSFAVDFLQEHGHKTCINGINPHNYYLLNPKNLVAHKLKISSSSSFMDGNDITPDFIDWIKAADPIRIIMHHCDSMEVIDAGIKNGVRLFQGREVDSILRKREE